MISEDEEATVANVRHEDSRVASRVRISESSSCSDITNHVDLFFTAVFGLRFGLLSSTCSYL
jgi:hypothetical protein